MANNPGDSVRIVLFNRTNPHEVLVLDESDDIGNFKLPGGKFDSPDETPEEAGTREQNEELISDEDDTRLHKAGELVNDDGTSKRYIFWRIADPDMISGSDDVHSMKWVAEPPEGKNQHHMQTAIELAREALEHTV
jgi:8-oxo-dGTP pyrophosphatase MutT (NUDIX family)